jgi:hypothetical protein
MNIFVSRDGQTFGPYSLEQAKQYLDAGQLLPSDFAVIEGQAEWKSLTEILGVQTPGPASQPAPVQAEQSTPQPTTPVETSVASETKPKVTPKEGGKKVRKIKSAAQVQTVYVAQKKGIVSRILSTIMVFTFMMLLAVGGLAGAYFVMPEKLGPIFEKFGLPVDQLLAASPIGEKEGTTPAVTEEPKSADDISLDPESFQTLRQSGIRILPIENDKGLQIIAPADPPMEDNELETLMPIANHVVSLDLPNSKITDEGMNSITKLVNLRKLNLEGSSAISVSGASKLKSMEQLEHLNLINVKLEDSIVDTLSAIQSLREVYLFNCGISEEAIKRLKSERPKIFVNAG